MNPVSQAVLEARQLLIDSFDFDIYADPIVVERLMCRCFNIKQTSKQSQYDGVHSSGITVEIKLASVTFNKTTQRLVYEKLQGESGKKIKAEVYLLVGYVEGAHRYFVIPAHSIGTRPRIEILIQERIYNVGTWLNFEVEARKVEKAIVSRGNAYRSIKDLGFNEN